MKTRLLLAMTSFIAAQLMVTACSSTPTVPATTDVPAAAAAGELTPLPPVPSAASADMAAGATALSSGDLVTAKAAFERAQRTAPSHAAPVVNLAITAMMAGEAQAALTLAERASKMAPMALEPQLTLIEAYLGVGYPVEALAVAQRTAELAPSSVDAHYLLGSAYLALGQVDEAKAALREALRLNPNDLTTQVALFTLEGGDADSDVTNNPYAQLSMGATAEQNGDKAAARKHYAAAIASDPTLHWAHYNLARLVHETDGLDAARPHYQAFIDRAPASAAKYVDHVRELLKT